MTKTLRKSRFFACGRKPPQLSRRPAWAGRLHRKRIVEVARERELKWETAFAILRLVVGLAVLVGFVSILGWRYREELTHFGQWFVDRFGWKEVALKPLRNIFAPVIIPTLPNRTFRYKGEDLPHVYHRYNMTWASERCVEVPIGRWWAGQFEAGAVQPFNSVRHQ